MRFVSVFIGEDKPNCWERRRGGKEGRKMCVMARDVVVINGTKTNDRKPV